MLMSKPGSHDDRQPGTQYQSETQITDNTILAAVDIVGLLSSMTIYKGISKTVYVRTWKAELQHVVYINYEILETVE